MTAGSAAAKSRVSPIIYNSNGISVRQAEDSIIHQNLVSLKRRTQMSSSFGYNISLMAA
jgi:nitrous oxidase accessory protein NosD